MRARRIGGAGLLVAALLAGPLLPGAAVAAGPEDLQLSAVGVSAQHELSLVATVPAVLSSTDLSTAAFTATQGGRPVAVTATRVVDGPFELVLALDTSADAGTLRAQESAAADLLRALPAQTPTVVLPGAVRTTAVGALPVLARLGPGSGRLLDGLPATTAVRRLVVVLADCPALDGETRSAGGPGTEVSVLAMGTGCGAGAARVAGPDPGIVSTGLDVSGLLGGVDQVARAVLGQYVVRSTSAIASGDVQVTLHAGTAVASATAVLAQPTATAVRGSRGDRAVWPVAAAAVLVAVVAAALGLELLARRRAVAPT